MRWLPHWGKVSNELVKAVRAGLRKTHGEPPARSSALEYDDLCGVLRCIDGMTPMDLRDRALIALGFAGAFRRSELVDLTFEQLEPVPEGLKIHLLRSKANKFGDTEIKPIPWAYDPTVCPVQALKDWANSAGISSGYVSRRISADQILEGPISAGSFYTLLKTRVQQAGLDASNITPHSLRSGFITSAYRADSDRYRIKQVTGHRSDQVLDSYIRDGDLFTHCAGRFGEPNR